MFSRLANADLSLVQGDLQERHAGGARGRPVEGRQDHHQRRSADRQQPGSGHGSRKILLQSQEQLRVDQIQVGWLLCCIHPCLGRP